MNKNITLIGELVRREIRSRYLDSLSGFAWLIIQPLMLLLIYSFVFTVIFQMRFPETETVGFLPYLAVAFWPWTAFSEAVLKSVNSVTSNAALIDKVAISSEVFPIATVISTFVMHSIGYVAILLVLTAFGIPIHWLGLLPALIVLITLFTLALALGLMVSSLNVFVRDLEHMLPPLMMLWFFATPILYPASMIPEKYSHWMGMNPMAGLMESLRKYLLVGDFTNLSSLVLPITITLIMLFLSIWFFRRLSPRFEDFF